MNWKCNTWGKTRSWRKTVLTDKKELLQYGFKVAKISIKEQTVDFEKVQGDT